MRATPSGTDSTSLTDAAGGTSATVNYQVGAGSGQTMAATFNTLYKNVKTVTPTNPVAPGDAQKEGWVADNDCQWCMRRWLQAIPYKDHPHRPVVEQ